MDFFKISERSKKNGLEIYPEFQVRKTSDLMVRGKEFYAVWDEEAGLWSKDEYDVRRLVDEELWGYFEEIKSKRSFDGPVKVMSMSDFSTRSWSEFRKYVTCISDNNHTLDEKLTFASTEVKKEDYISKRLPYDLTDADCPAWKELLNVLYEPDERAKIEWCIGAVVSGDSRDIQKFATFYGEAGTGKGTVLTIVDKLFEGYTTTFDAKALGASNNQFATDMFRTNPLVAIQYDGDLSKIEDNTKLNSIISHEPMVMNEKYKSGYSARTNCFLFLGTNKPVKITDARSGIIRRLIDIHPSGRLIEPSRYMQLMSRVEFELGAISKHCLDIYNQMGKHYYSRYKPYQMMLQTDVFFNFVEANYEIFRDQDSATLNQAYSMYKQYCDEALVEFKLARHKFREELKSYFKEFVEVTHVEGKSVRGYYKGFLKDKVLGGKENSELRIQNAESIVDGVGLQLKESSSKLDILLAQCPAQYASVKETPLRRWAEVSTTLSDISTGKLHYVKPPVEHIVIDFDLKDENGAKSAKRNLEEAAKWPPTYAEFSKGGAGVHLHYIYDGDVTKLSPIYKEGVEVKVFLGNASLRRRLTKCNNLDISTLHGGLPERREKRMMDFTAAQTEKGLRTAISNCLMKKHHGATKPEIDLIFKLLDDAKASGLKYDVSDLRPKVRMFAMKSTNQSDYCLKRFAQMEWKGEEPVAEVAQEEAPIIFFDVEVFPNLFLLNWKYDGIDGVTRMICQ